MRREGWNSASFRDGTSIFPCCPDDQSRAYWSFVQVPPPLHSQSAPVQLLDVQLYSEPTTQVVLIPGPLVPTNQVSGGELSVDARQ